MVVSRLLFVCVLVCNSSDAALCNEPNPSQGIALSLGDRITVVQRGLSG